MSKYYVYHGYVSPDNYDCSEGPTYRMSDFNSSQDVVEFKKEFDECICDECSNVIFRVIRGSEMWTKPIQVVTEYELTNDTRG